MAPPSMPSPRRAPNLTLAAPPPSAPAIVPLESPEPRRVPLVVKAAPMFAPSGPPWPSFSRGSRLAVSPSPGPRAAQPAAQALPPPPCLAPPVAAAACYRRLPA